MTRESVKPKISAAMLDVLRAIAAIEQAGYIGARPGRYNASTIRALSRRSLIAPPNVDGSRSLTKLGWRLLKGSASPAS